MTATAFIGANTSYQNALKAWSTYKALTGEARAFSLMKNSLSATYTVESLPSLISAGLSSAAAIAGTAFVAWEATSYTFNKINYADGQNIIDFYADEAYSHGLANNNQVISVNTGPFSFRF